MAYNENKEPMRMSDLELMDLIESEMTQEDIEADRKMMEALRSAPPQLKQAWQLANDALGMMPLQSIGTPLNNKIAEVCWALSDWAEELANNRSVS